MTSRARQLGHVLAHLLAGKVGIGFLVPPANVIEHPFKGHVNVPDPTKVIFIMEVKKVVAIAVENLFLLLLWQLVKWRIQVDAGRLAELFQQCAVPLPLHEGS